MRLTIKSLDYAPEELYSQEPIEVELLREMAGPDRPDYWLAKSDRLIHWMQDNHQREITHLILAARWHGTRIQPGIEHMPVGIAFVLDESVITDPKLDLTKCHYSAIGLAYDTTDGRQPRPVEQILSGHIGAAFQTGTSAHQSGSQRKPWWRLWMLSCTFTHDDTTKDHRPKKGEQNRCRQRLEGYLSCQQRLALAVA